MTSDAAKEDSPATETGLEAYLGSILDTIAEGVEIIGADGHVSFANLAAEDMFGPREEIIGRHYDDPRWRLMTPEGAPLPPDEMPQSRVMKTGKPVLDARYSALLPDGRQIVLTMNAVPFLDDSGTIVGTLVSYTDVTRRSIAVALDVALTEIGAAVNSSFEFDTILQRALDMAVGALGCESGILFLKQDSGWVMSHVTNLPEDMRGTRLSEGEAGFSAPAGDRGTAIAFNDVEDDDPLHARIMRRFQIKSLLDVALRVRGRDMGDVSFIYTSKAVSFTEDDVAFANKFGVIVGLALEASELYSSQQETSRILQEALLGEPAPIPGIACSHVYRSSTASAVVGGDFYDLFEVDDDHVAVVLGDVSGHGLSRATIAALAKYTMNAYLSEGDFPAHVLKRTNRLVYKSTDESTFVTAFVGLLDKRTGVLEYCNAAHPDPLVLRKRGVVEKLAARSPLMGAFPQTEFEPSQALLAAGDVLLLYTDGVVEARGPSGFFGEERLVSLLARSSEVSVGKLAGHIMNEVTEYAWGALPDDVAIMAIERSGNAVP